MAIGCIGVVNILGYLCIAITMAMTLFEPSFMLQRASSTNIIFDKENDSNSKQIQNQDFQRCNGR